MPARHPNRLTVRSSLLVSLLAVAACGAPADDEGPGAETLGAATSGGGLRGDYFKDTALKTLALTRTDADVNFFWQLGSPAAGVPSDGFSVRWTGYVTPRFSETYTFSTYADDGTRLWVNGQELINDWNHHPLTWKSGQITLKANQGYEIRLEYFDQTGLAQAQLNWQSASEPYAVIPSSRLSPSAPASSAPTSTTTAPPPPPSATGFMPGVITAVDMQNYQAWLGPKSMQVVGSYGGDGHSDGSWSTIENPHWVWEGHKSWVDADPTHRTVQVGVIPWPEQHGNNLHDCAAGKYDSHYKAMGENYVKAGLPKAILRFAWEQDGTWFEWGVAPRTSSNYASQAADFAGCFRHFHDAVKGVAPALQLDFYVGGNDDAWDDAVYPGDSYVDRVNHDIYDMSYWAPAKPAYKYGNAAATTEANAFYPFPAGCDETCMAGYQENAWEHVLGRNLINCANFATAHHKPFDVGEFGVGWTNKGGLNAAGAGHGGLDDPGFIQHIYNLMHGTEPGQLAGFLPGFATYWDYAGDADSAGKPTIDTRLHPASGSTAFPRAAAKFQQLWGH